MSASYSRFRGYHFCRVSPVAVALYFPATCADCNKPIATAKGQIFCQDDKPLIRAGVKPCKEQIEIGRNRGKGELVCAICYEAWKDPNGFYRKNPLIIEQPQ